MTTIEEADTWIGRTAVDSTGVQMGMVSKIWVDDASGEPEWASVKSSYGGQEALVPLRGSAPLGGGHQFAYSKEQIGDSPLAAQDGHLEVQDMERASSYYGTIESMTMETGWVDRATDASVPVNRTASAPPAPPAANPSPAADPDPSPEKKRSRFRRK